MREETEGFDCRRFIDVVRSMSLKEREKSRYAVQRSTAIAQCRLEQKEPDRLPRPFPKNDNTNQVSVGSTWDPEKNMAFEDRCQSSIVTIGACGSLHPCKVLFFVTLFDYFFLLSVLGLSFQMRVSTTYRLFWYKKPTYGQQFKWTKVCSE